MKRAGDKIHFTEDQWDAIKAQTEEIELAEASASIALSKAHHARKKLWETVREMIPESEDYNLSLNSKKKCLVILNRISKRCDGCDTIITFEEGDEYEDDDGLWCARCWMRKRMPDKDTNSGDIGLGALFG